MYQADFICTYKQMDTQEEQEQLYKIQLLQAFNLENWDDYDVNTIVIELYNLLQADPHLQTILAKVATIEDLQVYINMAGADTDVNERNILLFTFLFQYDFFNLFHMCIIDFMHKGHMQESTVLSCIRGICRKVR
jgi:hypothetical protein